MSMQVHFAELAMSETMNGTYQMISSTVLAFDLPGLALHVGSPSNECVMLLFVCFSYPVLSVPFIRHLSNLVFGASLC